MNAPDKHQGFTLIELVAVIILLGIVGLGTTQFITGGVQIYSDTAIRDDLGQQGRFTIERIARELRNAMPGSIRLGSGGGVQCIEFMPVLGASFYLGVPGSFSDTIANTATPITTFNAVPFTSIAGATRVAVYTLSPNQIYDTANTSNTSFTGVGTTTNGVTPINIGSNTFPADSPQRRFYLYDTPVSFCVSEGEVVRYAGYVATASQSFPPGSGGARLSSNVSLTDQDGNAVTAFQLTPGLATVASRIDVSLFFTTAERDEWLRFNSTVAIRNAP